MNEDCVRDAAAPVIEYSESLKDTQKIKAGKSLILSVNILGSPTPKASWWRNDAEVKSGLDVTIEGDGTFSRLTVKNTSGDVTGKYKVLAENSVGSDSAEFNVVILGQFNSHLHIILWNCLLIPTISSAMFAVLEYTLCPRKNCTPRQCTVELSSPNAS